MERNVSYEDLQKDLQVAHLEMLESEIKLITLERIAKANMLDSNLKKKLLFLISMSHEELPKLQQEDGNSINLLGLSEEMISQSSKITFTSKEIQVIEDIFFKEFHKITKEISDSVVEFNTEIISEADICKVAQDLQKLGMDVNAEIENLVECQNELIDLKYKTVLGKQIKKVEMSEKDLLNTLELASDLYKNTLNAVYPSKDCYDKITVAASSFEEELSKLNNELEEIKSTKEMYKQLDPQEFKNIVYQYKQVMREIKLKEMALRELKGLGNNSDNGSLLLSENNGALPDKNT